MNKKMINKMINHLTRLINVAEEDEKIYGSCFVEFGDRSLQVLKEPGTLL